MGRHRIEEITETEGGSRHWGLWTRGGTSGVSLQEIGKDEWSGGPEIPIPSETLRKLVAEDRRSSMIAALEQMEPEDVLRTTLVTGIA